MNNSTLAHLKTLGTFAIAILLTFLVMNFPTGVFETKAWEYIKAVIAISSLIGLFSILYYGLYGTFKS